MNPPDSRPLAGGAAAAAAFLGWGLLTLFWKALAVVPPVQILCHRTVWSLVFCALWLAVRGRMGEVRAALARPRTRLALACSGALLAANWFTYIWAVNNDRVLETSLGYYLTPLVNATLGMVVLRERLSRFQLAAVLLAGAGVLNLVLAYGKAPWAALVLAGSFGTYGLVRKTVGVAPLPGLFCETLLLAPPALAWLVWLAAQGRGAFPTGAVSVDGLLAVSGVVTTVPLVWFAYAARNLRLTTLGLFQYIAPTVFLLLGTLVYHEPFTTAHGATFALIWAGVALYSAASRRMSMNAPG